MTIHCPVWPEAIIELADTISFDELVRLYRRQFGIDISSEVPPDGFSLYRNVEADFCFFVPTRAGSSRFYKELYNNKVLYVGEKPEYRWAANFVPNGARVLDVGCGAGNFGRHIERAIFKGVEPNEDSVAYAKRHGRDVECIMIDEVARRGDQFDVVTTFQVLEHVEDPRSFFCDCVKVLKPGGLLIVSVPNLNGYMGARENTPLNLPPHHITWWSMRSLVRLGGENGLSVLDYSEERLVSLADYFQIIFKDGVDRVLGRPMRLVRNGVFDRALNRLFFTVGRLAPRPRRSMSANGHSVTVVYKKLREC